MVSPRRRLSMEDDSGDEVGSSDELGLNGVPIKRPRPPPPAQGSDDDDSDSDSSASGYKSDAAWPEPAPQHTAEVPELAESSSLPEKEAAKSPVEPPAPAGAVEDGHFQAKSAAYPLLWSELQAAGADLGMPAAILRATFLKFDDATAAVLNKKISKQMLAKAKVFMERLDIEKEVAGVLYNLIK